MAENSTVNRSFKNIEPNRIAINSSSQVRLTMSEKNGRDVMENVDDENRFDRDAGEYERRNS